MGVVVAADHSTASVTKPAHEHLLRDAVVGAHGTEEMSEAVDTAVSEADGLAKAHGKPAHQWLDHTLHQPLQNAARLDPGALRAMEHESVLVPWERLQELPNLVVDRELPVAFAFQLPGI